MPYYRGEDFRRCHARRLSANLEQEANVHRWCGQRGLTLRITNEGHHWQIADGGFLAEWWPSSAKLVIGKKWHDGIHCHDYKQALKVIEDFYRNQRLLISIAGMKVAAALQQLIKARFIKEGWICHVTS